MLRSPTAFAAAVGVVGKTPTPSLPRQRWREAPTLARFVRSLPRFTVEGRRRCVAPSLHPLCGCGILGAVVNTIKNTIYRSVTRYA